MTVKLLSASYLAINKPIYFFSVKTQALLIIVLDLNMYLLWTLNLILGIMELKKIGMLKHLFGIRSLIRIINKQFS